MAQQTISLGTSGTNSGDTIRDAFDKVNDNFNETYVDISKRSLGGWHESQTRMKILPSDFVANNDTTSYNVAINDYGQWAEVQSTSIEPVCNITIPTGYKATKYKIYGSTSSRAIYIYENQIDDSTYVSKGGGFLNSEINMTDVTATSTNYLTIKLNLSATSDYIYGGYITIQKV